MTATLTTRNKVLGSDAKGIPLSRKTGPRSGKGRQRAVVVQSGARDAYQLARALAEAGMLEALVTDLYWPADRAWAKSLARYLPAGLRTSLLQRSESSLPSSAVQLCGFTGLATLLLDKLPGVPLSVRRRVTRYADATLGRTAGRLATRTNTGLISYSYYGYDAFTHYERRGMLFQLHPHPATMRRILTEELNAHPDCADSLRQEWELALPEEDFQHLVRETTMASRFLVASSFTRSTLVEYGTPESSVSIVPYGVDCKRFTPAPHLRSAPGSRLNLLFVGRINQRKGIKYLLEALRLLNTDNVHLTICGRVVDGLELFQPFASQVDIRPSVGQDELIAAYQSADLFVFPSIAEGFGQVLLESLACGLPILSTTRTAAPDLIHQGIEGFIIEPRHPELIAEHIEWAMTHRSELVTMGERARLCAEQFTWQRFRSGVANAVGDFLDSQGIEAESRFSHV
jgi:glycosyltransferase involved in cell wall biosynthesis